MVEFVMLVAVYMGQFCNKEQEKKPLLNPRTASRQTLLANCTLIRGEKIQSNLNVLPKKSWLELCHQINSNK